MARRRCQTGRAGLRRQGGLGHYTGSGSRHKIAGALCSVGLLLSRGCPAWLGLGEAFRMKRAFVFPGQGSQTVGMGRSLAEAFPVARHLFEEVDETLSQPLSRLMFEGPESDLTLTENAQPALLAASLAVIRVLQAEAGFDVGTLAYVAGHSLGEYSAHAAAGTFSVPDAVRLVKRRGLAMQKAVPVGEGAMAALLGLEIEAA